VRIKRWQRSTEQPMLENVLIALLFPSSLRKTRIPTEFRNFDSVVNRFVHRSCADPRCSDSWRDWTEICLRSSDLDVQDARPAENVSGRVAVRVNSRSRYRSR